ncbi:MAG: hypothetical protein U1C96_09305 [Gallionella sp.]|nr:hypothetical protein [Gallionella sp.]
MKKSRYLLLGLLAVGAVVAYLWFNNPLNGLLKHAIEKYGSEMTGATVRVGKVQLSPTDGHGVLSNLSLGNPPGFETSHAFKAGHVEVALVPESLTKDVLLIRKIAIESPDISYEKGKSGTNFDAIQRNVERYLGTSKQQKADEPGRKMIIDSLTIRNIKVNYNGMIELKLPDIELRNIGKRSGGATSAQVTKAIISELNTKLMISLAKTVAIGAVGGVAIGVGMGIKSLFGD